MASTDIVPAYILVSASLSFHALANVNVNSKAMSREVRGLCAMSFPYVQGAGDGEGTESLQQRHFGRTANK